jgi:hypothetical protein
MESKNLKKRFKKSLLTFLTIALLSSNATVKAQNQENVKPSAEKSVFGAQAGLLGIWVNNEAKLTKAIALRSEIGFDGGFWGGNFYPKNGYVFTPIITAEPRFYYNLGNRTRKNKSIKNNSANFISLKTSFHPDWFTISNYENVSIVSDLSIIPTWGIRRHIGSHFNYEAGLGVGYRYYFAKGAGYLKNESDVAVNLHLRIGYTF